jgi:hypothetical protein
MMHPFFAASIFDSPWIIVAIVLVSIISNWLSKRRQAKEAEQQQRESPRPPESAGQPAQDFDLEETLRRLMGEEQPPKAPAPPPLPPTMRREVPPEPSWEEREPAQPAWQTPPPIRLPPLPVAQPRFTPTVVGEQQREAARRFEQLNEQGRHPATVVSHGHRSRSPSGSRLASQWRNPRRARQAFVASIVFAPPKGLEP